MAQPAPLDALAHLACPPVPKANRGAAALHAGQLLAYAAGAAVVVADVSCTGAGWAGSSCAVLHREPAGRPPRTKRRPLRCRAVQAQSMSVATTLSGAHRQAAVTALAWCGRGVAVTQAGTSAAAGSTPRALQQGCPGWPLTPAGSIPAPPSGTRAAARASRAPLLSCAWPAGMRRGGSWCGT